MPPPQRPVDAAFNCIERIVKEPGILRDYDLKAVTMGRMPWVKPRCEWRLRDDLFRHRTSPDIIEASARAYLNAFNRFFSRSHT